MAETANYVEMQGISKRFGGVQALCGVDFDLRSGEIHALMGENGAGKTTLMKVLSGVYAKDEGTTRVAGKEEDIRNTMDSSALGISVIWQEFALMPHLSVAENILIDDLSAGKAIINWKNLYKRARDILESLGYGNISEKSLVGELSVACQQVVEICKALARNARVLVLDEPTALLASSEVRKLFATLKSLRQQGKSIVYISHRLEEVFELSDRITVLKDGKYVATVNTPETTSEDLVKLMVGRDPSDLFPEKTNTQQEVVFKVENISLGHKVNDVSFDVRKGEVFGMAGLVGAGRTETMRAIFGVDKREQGKIYLNGKELEIKSPHDSFQNGIGLLPEDRKGQGVLLKMPISYTITLSSLKRFCGFLGKINRRQELAEAEDIANQLQLKYGSMKLNTASLSGGNQQKVALAKLLSARCNVLILDEPTRGVDVGAKTEIYRIVREIAAQGNAVVVISSEMMEIIGLCDRVAVMREGKITAILEGDDINEQTIIDYSMGVKS